MEKIFKKSLALVLSAALCLTALIGCLTVSAEETTANPTYVIDAVEGIPGETVTVTADITNVSKVCAHLIDIVFPKDLTIGDVTDSLNRTYLTVEQWEATGNNSEIPAYNLFEDAEGKHIRFVEFVNWPDTTVVSELKVYIEFKIPEGATAGKVYDLTPTIQAGKYDDDTKLMDVALTPGKVTVKTSTVEPVLDSNLTFFSRSSSAQDTLGIGYVLRKSTVTNYSKFEIVSTATKYNSSRNKEVAAEVVLPIKETTSFYTATYTGIAMYELDLPISTYIKCYDADGNYVAYSETVTDTPADLLKQKYDTSTSTLFKTMVTDMLNLGAAAQTYFGSQTSAAGSDLANATLINDGWDQTYATPGDLTDLTILDELEWAENSPLTSADITFSTSLNHAATPTLGYLIRDLNKSLNADDLTLEVTYEAKYPKTFAGTRSDTVTGSKFIKAGSYFTYAFSGMTLADSDRTITATLYYKGARVLTYNSTMETAINAKLTGSETSVALSVALGKFEASTRAYFAAN